MRALLPKSRDSFSRCSARMAIQMPSQMPAKVASVAKRPPELARNCWTGLPEPKRSLAQTGQHPTVGAGEDDGDGVPNQHKARRSIEPTIRRGSVVFSLGERR